RSHPVKITLRRESTIIGSGTANADGSFTIDNVKLESGSNLIFAQAADTTFDASGDSSGNISEFAGAVTVILDQTAPVVIPGGVVISSPGTEPGLNAPLCRVATGISRIPEDSRAGFLPPLPGDENDRRLILPATAVSDPNPSRVTVWLVYRRCDESPTCYHQRQLPLGGRGFETWLPAPGPGLFYRFQLSDRAGNLSWLPVTGEFWYRPVRSARLRCIEYAETHDEVPATDEWPISALGLPPGERLSAYRSIEVPKSAYAAMRARIDSMPGHQKPDLVLCASPATEPENGSWLADLETVNAGKAESLPDTRRDLLIEDIRNGIIPDDLLPVPENLPDSGFTERIAEAIRFRRLHDLSSPGMPANAGK
ncbi:MAG TPA: hypothetical protein PKM25_00130, partial [Candidatus Ozemobacteraceae bacterium]|nr:hypothetical protein [Candidatus Ozemobacteraceae bacterium]